MRSNATHYILAASTKVKVVFIRSNSACMCCKEDNTTNLGIKIHNFVTHVLILNTMMDKEHPEKSAHPCTSRSVPNVSSIWSCA